jgi:hypothetical protein
MRIRVALLVLSSMMVLTGRASAQVPPETTHAAIGLNLWSPTPELNVQGVDFVNTLGIEEKRFNEVRVILGGAHKLRFSYLPIEYAETGKSITTTVTFEGQTFTGTVPVDYEFKWDLYRIGYEWDFVRFGHGFVGAIAELKYNKVSASVSSVVATASIEDVKAPIPTVGGIARGYLGNYVSITGEFTGLKLDRDEFRGKFYDFDLYGQLNLTKALAVQVGYRSVDVDYLVDEDQGTFTMKGPYFGGLIRF